MENEIKSREILSPSKEGSRKTYRAIDHTSTLFSFIKKAISHGNYLYTCFVDFRKAYMLKTLITQNKGKRIDWESP